MRELTWPGLGGVEEAPRLSAPERPAVKSALSPHAAVDLGAGTTAGAVPRRIDTPAFPLVRRRRYVQWLAEPPASPAGASSARAVEWAAPPGNEIDEAFDRAEAELALPRRTTRAVLAKVLFAIVFSLVLALAAYAAFVYFQGSG